MGLSQQDLAYRLTAALSSQGDGVEVSPEALRAIVEDARREGVSLADVVAACEEAGLAKADGGVALGALLEPFENERRNRWEVAGRMVEIYEGQRLRLAGEIHDESIQLMAAAYMRLQMLRRKLTVPADQQACGELEDNVRRCVESLRRVIYELKPSALEEEGLAAALTVQMEQREQASGVTFTLRNDVATEPPPRTRLILYRLAQETLNNLQKHRKPTGAPTGVPKQIAVVLTQDDVSYSVSISESSAAPSAPDERPPVTAGLAGVKEVAEAVGGSCGIEHSPDGAATVHIRVPAA